MSEVKWLLVGTGDVVRKRVAAALATARGGGLVGVCGSSDSRVAEIADRFGASERYTNLAQALKQTTADAVYLARPVHYHADEAVAALAAGKHVLVEKPLGLNAADAKRIVAAAAKSPNLRAGCAYYRRCSARYSHARRMVEAGALGRIVLVRLTCVSWFNPAADDPKHWRVEPGRSGGGPLADVGSHMLDILIGLLGVPTRVAAHVKTLIHDYEVEDTAAALMALRGGGEALASFAWSSRTWAHELEITGAEAKLTWSPFDAGPVVLTRGREVERLDLPPAENMHLPLVEDFIDAVREGRDPACPVAEAMKTNELMDAIYASGREDVSP